MGEGCYSIGTLPAYVRGFDGMRAYLAYGDVSFSMVIAEVEGFASETAAAGHLQELRDLGFDTFIREMAMMDPQWAEPGAIGGEFYRDLPTLGDEATHFQFGLNAEMFVDVVSIRVGAAIVSVTSIVPSVTGSTVALEAAEQLAAIEAARMRSEAAQGPLSFAACGSPTTSGYGST
jgi:hypothetical protein